jgi:hypothetical protein
MADSIPIPRLVSEEEIDLLEQIAQDEYVCTHIRNDDWRRALTYYFRQEPQA